MHAIHLEETKPCSQTTISFVLAVWLDGRDALLLRGTNRLGHPQDQVKDECSPKLYCDPPMKQAGIPQRPSQAWLRAVFDSPPRRDIENKSGSTTRHPHYANCVNQRLCAEGGNENGAMLLFEQLWREGYVTRFKTQPFILTELDGPAGRVPDFLVELFDGRVYVVQIKAERFCTDPVKKELDIDRTFLLEKGFEFLLWTDKSVLTHEFKTNMLSLDKAAQHPPAQHVLDDLELSAQTAKTLGDLQSKFGWEEIMAAIAYQKIFVSHLESYHEETPFSLTASFTEADFLFQTGTEIFQQRRGLRPAVNEKWGITFKT